MTNSLIVQFERAEAMARAKPGTTPDEVQATQRLMNLCREVARGNLTDVLEISRRFHDCTESLGSFSNTLTPLRVIIRQMFDMNRRVAFSTIGQHIGAAKEYQCEYVRIFFSEFSLAGMGDPHAPQVSGVWPQMVLEAVYGLFGSTKPTDFLHREHPIFSVPLIESDGWWGITSFEDARSAIFTMRDTLGVINPGMASCSDYNKVVDDIEKIRSNGAKTFPNRPVLDKFLLCSVKELWATHANREASMRAGTLVISLESPHSLKFSRTLPFSPKSFSFDDNLRAVVKANPNNFELFSRKLQHLLMPETSISPFSFVASDPTTWSNISTTGSHSGILSPPLPPPLPVLHVSQSNQAAGLIFTPSTPSSTGSSSVSFQPTPAVISPSDVSSPLIYEFSHEVHLWWESFVLANPSFTGRCVRDAMLANGCPFKALCPLLSSHFPSSHRASNMRKLVAEFWLSVRSTVGPAPSFSALAPHPPPTNTSGVPRSSSGAQSSLRSAPPRASTPPRPTSDHNARPLPPASQPPSSSGFGGV